MHHMVREVAQAYVWARFRGSTHNSVLRYVVLERTNPL